MITAIIWRLMSFFRIEILVDFATEKCLKVKIAEIVLVYFEFLKQTFMLILIFLTKYIFFSDSIFNCLINSINDFHTIINVFWVFIVRQLIFQTFYFFLKLWFFLFSFSFCDFNLWLFYFKLDLSFFAFLKLLKYSSKYIIIIFNEL